MSKKHAIDLLAKMRAGGVKGFLRDEKYRAAAKNESDTGRLNLQERRMVTGARTALVNELTEKLIGLKRDDPDYAMKAAELANSISVLAMAGVLEKNDLSFDALAYEQDCKVVPKEIQEQFPDDENEQKKHAVPGFRRVSTAELLLDIRDMMEMVMDAVYIHAEMFHETLMRQKFFTDENQVNRSPYREFFDSDYLAKDDPEEVVKEGEQGASTRKKEDRSVDLDKVREFVAQKG